MAARPELLKELLELPSEERAELAYALLESLEPADEGGEYVPTPEEEAMIDEAVEAARQGGGIPADEFLRQLRATR
jgi:hypothetical protein